MTIYSLVQLRKYLRQHSVPQFFGGVMILNSKFFIYAVLSSSIALNLGLLTRDADNIEMIATTDVQTKQLKNEIKISNIKNLTCGSTKTDSETLSLSDSLRTLNIPEETIRQFKAFTLSQSMYKSHQEAPYWQQQSGNKADHLRANLQSEQQLREALLAEFGEDIKYDESFAYLFRPLSGHDYIDSEDQIEIHIIKKQAMLNLLENPRDIHALSFSDDQIKSILSDDDYFEYSLRESPIAKNLKHQLSGLDYNEQEFRDLFAILNSSASQQPSEVGVNHLQQVGGLSDVDVAIKDYLGEDRFDEYLSVKKPSYKKLLDVAEQYHIDSETTKRTHKIVEITISRLASIRQNGSIPADKKQQQMQDLVQATHIKIGDIVGSDVAESIINDVFL